MSAPAWTKHLGRARDAARSSHGTSRNKSQEEQHEREEVSRPTRRGQAEKGRLVGIDVFAVGVDPIESDGLEASPHENRYRERWVAGVQA